MYYCICRKFEKTGKTINCSVQEYMLRKVRKMVTFGRTKEIVIGRGWLVMFFFLSWVLIWCLLCVVHWAVHFCIVYFADWELYFTTKKGVFKKKRVESFHPNSVPQWGESIECLCVRLAAPSLKPRGEWDIKINAMIPVLKQLTVLRGMRDT